MSIKSLLTTLTPKQITQIQSHILKSPKPHSLNKLLTSLTNSPNPQNALYLYNQMILNPNPLSHNHFTFTLALKACSLSNSLYKGQEIHAHITKLGCLYDTFVQNSLIHFYVVVIESGIFSACRVFDEIDYPDVVSWTSIVSGFCKCGFHYEAIGWFLLMNVKPNANTLVCVFSACSSLGELKLGKGVHCYGLKNFCGVNVILDNVVLDFYVKCGSLEIARYLFDKMPKRDVVSWSSMVGGLVQRGFCKDAVRVFEEMVKEGEAVPNQATIVNVLAACASLGSLSLGQWVHSYVNTQCGLLEDGNVGNALLNMYIKCGNVGMAVCVFYTIKWKDVISWSTLISGLAMNGYGKHALPLFSLMLVHGVCPDHITFIGLLSSCSHSGLVKQGLMLYKSMTEVCGIVPQVQHCACVVDLYGRAGMLEEAEGFIRDMRVEADAAVWGALLNACRLHGNKDMFERIKRSLPSATALSVGTFALLSNTFASSDSWDEANEVRKEMRCLGLKKIAGRSWIEVVTESRTSASAHVLWDKLLFSQ